MIEIRCEIPAKIVDKLEGWFCEYAGCSPWCLYQETDDSPHLLHGYFASEEEMECEWAELRAQFKKVPETYERIEREDSDWQNAYKAFLQPWHSRGLHWIPVWERETITVPDDEVAIYFDAGMAFGTGSHETTRLCAERMLDYIEEVGGREKLEAHRLIDAGCGSGILALSGRRLGFGHVYAFDHDPEAAKVTRENLASCGLTDDEVNVAQAGLEDGLAGQEADLLLANIQCDILTIHAEALLASVRPGGTLALSGILAEEITAARTCFEPKAGTLWGGCICDSHILGEWADLTLRRPAP